MADSNSVHPLHRWSVMTWLHCRECREFRWHCPGCGAEQCRELVDNAVPPVTGAITCTRCRSRGSVTLLGYAPVAQLQDAFDLPAADRPAPLQTASSGNQAPISSVPIDDVLLPLSEWGERDPSLRERLVRANNSRIAAAHRRAGGQTYRAQRGGRPLLYRYSEIIRALDQIERVNSLQEGRHE